MQNVIPGPWQACLSDIPPFLHQEAIVGPVAMHSAAGEGAALRGRFFDLHG